MSALKLSIKIPSPYRVNRLSPMCRNEGTDSDLTNSTADESTQRAGRMWENADLVPRHYSNEGVLQGREEGREVWELSKKLIG